MQLACLENPGTLITSVPPFLLAFDEVLVALSYGQSQLAILFSFRGLAFLLFVLTPQRDRRGYQTEPTRASPRIGQDSRALYGRLVSMF